MKGLDALEKIKSHNYHETPKRECLVIIETELKEYEKIKNHAVEVVKEFFGKELKALEVIKETINKLGVSFQFIDRDLVICIYIDHEFERLSKCKNKEEYDLLKEVLK